MKFWDVCEIQIVPSPTIQEMADMIMDEEIAHASR